MVDGIASRFGKSGGSLIFQVLFVLCGELVFTIPYVAMIFAVVFLFWFAAVRGLGKMVKRSIDSVGIGQTFVRDENGLATNKNEKTDSEELVKI